MHLDSVLQMWNEMTTLHSIAHLLVLGANQGICMKLRRYNADLVGAWSREGLGQRSGRVMCELGRAVCNLCLLTDSHAETTYTCSN